MANIQGDVAPRTLNLTCVVATVHGAMVSQCTLRNISRIGATIALDAPSSVPDEFILQLVRSGAVCRKCKIVWRNAINVGVRFL